MPGGRLWVGDLCADDEQNWTGTEADGAERGPVKVMCADGAPCTGIDITDFAMWTESGSTQWYSCESAYTNIHRSP